MLRTSQNKGIDLNSDNQNILQISYANSYVNNTIAGQILYMNKAFMLDFNGDNIGDIGYLTTIYNNITGITYHSVDICYGKTNIFNPQIIIGDCGYSFYIETNYENTINREDIAISTTDLNDDQKDDVVVFFSNGQIISNLGTIMYFVYGQDTATKPISISNLITKKIAFSVEVPPTSNEVISQGYGFTGGNFNGDQYPDIILGINTFFSNNGFGQLFYTILFGQKELYTSLDINQLEANTDFYSNSSSAYSFSLTDISGDYNGDGINDMIFQSGWDIACIYYVTKLPNTLDLSNPNFCSTIINTTSYNILIFNNARDVNDDGCDDLLLEFDSSLGATNIIAGIKNQTLPNFQIYANGTSLASGYAVLTGGQTKYNSISSTSLIKGFYGDEQNFVSLTVGSSNPYNGGIILSYLIDTNYFSNITSSIVNIDLNNMKQSNFEFNLCNALLGPSPYTFSISSGKDVNGDSKADLLLDVGTPDNPSIYDTETHYLVPGGIQLKNICNPYPSSPTSAPGSWFTPWHIAGISIGGAVASIIGYCAYITSKVHIIASAIMDKTRAPKQDTKIIKKFADDITPKFFCCSTSLIDLPDAFDKFALGQITHDQEEKSKDGSIIGYDTIQVDTGRSTTVSQSTGTYLHPTRGIQQEYKSSTFQETREAKVPIYYKANYTLTRLMGVEDYNQAIAGAEALRQQNPLKGYELKIHGCCGADVYETSNGTYMEMNDY